MMEEEEAVDGEKPPFMTGKQVSFIAEEVIKILKTVTDDQCTSKMPQHIKGKDI